VATESFDPTTVASLGSRLSENVARAVKAPESALRNVIVALLAEGHVLIEDYPGVGKTALARALARSIDAEYARLQCTADMLPGDVVGTNVYNQRENRFEFRPGPIFANVVLVDEINRASPKTQSGLLECMQERHVTVDVATHELARPFMVIATQNPIEYEGTFPLPEAQLDRFFVRTTLGYPDAEDEARIVDEQLGGHPLGRLQAVISTEEIGVLRNAVPAAFVHEAVGRWIVDLVRATRDLDGVAMGASVRGSLALERASRAWALLQGRDFVVPDDVERLFGPVILHRLLLTSAFLARSRARGGGDALAELRHACLERAPAPGSEDDPLFEGQRPAPGAPVP
jgi:MoxR-like ATPase